MTSRREPADSGGRFAGLPEVGAYLAGVLTRAAGAGAETSEAVVAELAASADLAAVLDAAAPRDLTPALLARLADSVLTDPHRLRETRDGMALLNALRRYPATTAALLAREEVFAAVLAARSAALDRALVRALEASAPLRSPELIATALRVLAPRDVRLDRLAWGGTCLLVAAFDEVAGVALGASGWLRAGGPEVAAFFVRLRDYPVESSLLFTRWAEHGRAQLAVAAAADDAWSELQAACLEALTVLEFLSAAIDESPTQRAARRRVARSLMRLTALQLVLAHRPGELPPALVEGWPRSGAGDRLPLVRLGRADLEHLDTLLDEAGLLVG